MRMDPAAAAFRCTYLLPIRRVRACRAEIEELAGYFRDLAHAGCELVVVDGSSPAIFAEHHRKWRELCLHVPVDQSTPTSTAK